MTRKTKQAAQPFDARTKHFAKVARGIKRLQQDSAGSSKEVEKLLQKAVKAGATQ